jgi:hypothetical protein
VFYLLIFPVICLFIIIGLMVALVRDAIRRTKRQNLRCQVSPTLLIGKELLFFNSLQATVPPGYRVCPKVNLRDVVQFENLDRISHAGAFEEIQNLRLDFVVIQSEGTRIAMVIQFVEEADAKVVEVERIVGEALVARGIPYFRTSRCSDLDFSKIEAAKEQTDQFAA